MKVFSRSVAVTLALSMALFGTPSSADKWRFDPVEKQRVESFGDTKIILTTDARRDPEYPEYVLEIFKGTELLAKYRGVGFEKIFAAPDQSIFVGLSNDGLPGTAVVIFDAKGNLRLEAKHDIATFDYCERSVTRVRRWFDEDKPDVQFIRDEQIGAYKAVTVRTCKGKTADVLGLVLDAYNRSFQLNASGVR